MKLLLRFAAIITIALCSCSPAKQSQTQPSQQGNSIATASNKGEDGLSYATAVVIKETSETKGIAAEYKWIKGQYAGYKIKGQALSVHKNKPYDIISIITAEGKELGLYFDISNFYGKF